jgi:hypothetical protein
MCLEFTKRLKKLGAQKVEKMNFVKLPFAGTLCKEKNFRYADCGIMGIFSSLSP